MSKEKRYSNADAAQRCRQNTEHRDDTQPVRAGHGSTSYQPASISNVERIHHLDTKTLYAEKKG